MWEFVFLVIEFLLKKVRKSERNKSIFFNSLNENFIFNELKI